VFFVGDAMFEIRTLAEAIADMRSCVSDLWGKDERTIRDRLHACGFDHRMVDTYLDEVTTWTEEEEFA
jgi:hypothetical protein